MVGVGQLSESSMMQVVGDVVLAQHLMAQPCVVKVFSRGEQACQEADCLGSAYISLAELAHSRYDRPPPQLNMLAGKNSTNT